MMVLFLLIVLHFCKVGSFGVPPIRSVKRMLPGLLSDPPSFIPYKKPITSSQKVIAAPRASLHGLISRAWSYANAKRTADLHQRVGQGAMLREVCERAWEHHKFMEHGDPEKGVPNQIAVYGIPVTLEDYCMQAQMAAYVQYRALVEGYSSKMWCVSLTSRDLDLNTFHGMAVFLHEFFICSVGAHGCSFS